MTAACGATIPGVRVKIVPVAPERERDPVEGWQTHLGRAHFIVPDAWMGAWGDREVPGAIATIEKMG